ncbi:Target of rapamycin [Gracilariopsis chorda]|uniref:Serine/threonine-protein kinase TOR n=1 Tax=Gracilariopsis chorda TaxID=448386 RepID=A0A2V3IU72_9FLOR|nr:Target of rapamycin [Gracilariopsis chorda]|eukprot:PXF45649.1 Target of rapamycin [Gracilariopsis chorda]
MLDFFLSGLEDTEAEDVNDVRRLNDIVDKLCVCTTNEERTRLATHLRTTVDNIPSDDNVTQNPHESSAHNNKRSQAVASLNRRLQALLVSERQGDRLAAIAAVSALLTTESEDIQARAQRAGNAVRLLFQTKNTDIPTAKAAAALVGALAKLNNALSTRAVDHALTNAINLIAHCHSEDPYPELSTDRARSALVITELAISNKSPQFIFRFHDNLRTELWHIVWDREAPVREQGVQALQAVLNSVLIADQSESNKAMEEVIERINISLLPSVEDVRAPKYKQERRNAVVHGSLLMTASLLRSSQSRPLLSSFAKDISSLVIRYQKSTSAAIRETVADILPLLVQVDSSIFAGDFLRELRTSALGLVRNTDFPSQERGCCLMSLAAIAEQISNVELGPLLKDMLGTCREALVLQRFTTSEKHIPQEAVLKAIIHLAKASKGHPVFAEFMREGMIALLMSTDFTGCLVTTMDEIGREVPDMVNIIREKLVNVIAATLKRRMPENALMSIDEGGGINAVNHRQIERSSSAHLLHNSSQLSFGNIGSAMRDFHGEGLIGEEASASHDFFKQYPIMTELHRIESDVALASNASSIGIDGLLDSPPGSQASSPSQGLSVRSLPELSVTAASDRENSPCVALKAIVSYTFTKMSTEDLTSFVSEFVIGYLHANSVKVRALAAAAAAKLLETAVKVDQNRGLGCDELPRLSPDIQSFVSQLLSFAVADPSKDVRYIAVRSLDREEFFEYLAQFETLNMLFVGFHDESAVLRRAALSLAGRLSGRHPARVIPALRRQLLHLLTVLRLHGNNFARNRRDATYLIYTLTCHAKHLVKPYTKAVMTLLLLCLGEAKKRNDSAAILPIYLTIAEMGGTMSPFDLSPFREKLVPQIVSSILQFQSSEPVMRKAALRALTGVVQNTGFVIKPYDAHRGLLPGLVQLLTVETDQNVRLEAEILIGSLGAVNPENHKYANLPRYLERQQFSQTRNLSIGSQDRGTLRNYASYTSGVQLGASGTHLTSSKLAALAASGQNSVNLKKESQQVREISAPKRKHPGWSSAHDESGPASLNPAVKAEDVEAAMRIFVYGVEYLERMTSYRPVWDTEDLENMSLVEELDHPFTNSPNYSSSVALDQLNLIIANPRQRPHYRDAVKAIVHILRSSGSKCSQFLPAVVPRILWLLAKTSKTDSSLGITFTELENQIMIRLQELISIAGCEYMPYVCDTVLLMWKFLKHLSSSPLCLITVCNLLSKLRIAIGDQFAPVIPSVLPYLLSSVTQDRSENGTSTVAVLKTLETFSPLYGEYDIIVIECLTKIILAKKLAVRREDALLTLIRIVQDLSSIEILPSVIQPLIQVIAGSCDRAVSYETVGNGGFMSGMRSRKVHDLSDGTELVVLASRALIEIGKRSARAFDVYIPVIRRALRLSTLKRIDRTVYNALENMLEQRVSQSLSSSINTIPCTVKAITLQPVHGSSGSLSDLSHSAHSLTLGRRLAFDFTQSSAQSRNPVSRKHNLMESALLRRWEVQPGFSEDDWVQWYSNLGAAMLEQSGSPAFRACVRISESYPQFSKLVFNAAFLSCWKHPLSSESKVKIVYNLEKALSSDIIPLNVLQSLLNLYEFMDHDEKPLPTSNMKLAIAACRCGAFAKAVRYRELDYAHHVGNPELIESDIDGEEGLISIYDRLNNLESAVGTLNHYQRHKGAKVKEMWFEKLQKWDEALEEYSKVEIDFRVVGDELYTDKTKWGSLLGRLRCLNEIGEWRKLNELVQDSKMACITNRRALGELALDGKGASVALDLGRWDEFEEWVRYLRPNTFHGCFYRAMVLVRQGSADPVRLDEAEDFLRNARKRLDLELTARVSEGYPRAYERVVDAQILVELEEMIAFLRMPESDSASYGRRRLRDIWDQRLRGCKHDRYTWYRLLMIRALVMKPIENKEQWLEFSTMCRKDRRIPMASEALRMLLKSYYEHQASIWSGIEGAPFVRDTYQHLFDFAKWSPQSIVTIQDLDIKFSCIKLLWALNRRIEAYSALEQCRNEYLESAGLGFTENGMLIGFPSEELEDERVIAGEVFSKLSKWGFRLAESKEVEETCITDPVVFADYAAKIRPEWGKAWHYWGNLNENRFLALVDKQGGIPDVGYHLGNGITIGKREKKYAVGAVRGYFKAIDLKSKTSTEDSLRVLTLWFNFGGLGNLHVDFDEGFNRTNITMWLEVVPQIIARLYTPYPEVERGVKILLAKIGKVHPQVAVYPLTVAKNVYGSHQEKRANTATQILTEIKQHHKEIVEEAEIVANELVRVAILWSEIWCERLEEASKLYFMNHKIFEMLETIMPLHDMMDRGAETGYEQNFIGKFGRELNDAAELCRKFQAEQHEGLSIEGPLSQYLNQAWTMYHNIFRKIQRQQQNIHILDLSFVSKGLDEARGLKLAVPGTYDPYDNSPTIAIHSFSPKLTVMQSKQRPRKLSIIGDDGEEYHFLLKGHEDLRQDERVMQVFSLVNKMFSKSSGRAVLSRVALKTYPVIALSGEAGLIGWVPGCDTMHSLVKEYREMRRIMANVEHRVMLRIAPEPDRLALLHKVQLFEFMLQNTGGVDIAKVLWLKSRNSEIWFERRTTYAKSLATTSMMGYLLGLGDRHPSNLMIERGTGKVMHIDFGDCFEVAMKREKYPERVPFRLTRMLVDALEPCGVDGHFRQTSEVAMEVLRSDARQSLLSMMEAFVYDPLIRWKLIKAKDLLAFREQRDASLEEAVAALAGPMEGEPDIVRSLREAGSLMASIRLEENVQTTVADHAEEQYPGAIPTPSAPIHMQAHVRFDFDPANLPTPAADERSAQRRFFRTADPSDNRITIAGNEKST